MYLTFKRLLREVFQIGNVLCETGHNCLPFTSSRVKALVSSSLLLLVQYLVGTSIQLLIWFPGTVPCRNSYYYTIALWFRGGWVVKSLIRPRGSRVPILVKNGIFIFGIFCAPIIYPIDCIVLWRLTLYFSSGAVTCRNVYTISKCFFRGGRSNENFKFWFLLTSKNNYFLLRTINRAL